MSPLCACQGLADLEQGVTLGCKGFLEQIPTVIAVQDGDSLGNGRQLLSANNLSLLPLCLLLGHIVSGLLQELLIVLDLLLQGIDFLLGFFLRKASSTHLLGQLHAGVLGALQLILLCLHECLKLGGCLLFFGAGLGQVGGECLKQLVERGLNTTRPCLILHLEVRSAWWTEAWRWHFTHENTAQEQRVSLGQKPASQLHGFAQER
mmetsp:Transcript_39173/g.92189  ORF Transcript_39173/g.92189 Transcript_39173/m.92189 type:complete len:206 (-) Transcript_39173:644-1261(-)